MTITLPNYATRFDALSLSVCFLDLKGVGDAPRHATGFFWRRSDKIFLITNWHVVTGINIMNGQSMAKGWSPERLVVEYFTKPVPAKHAGHAMAGPNSLAFVSPKLEIPLYREFHKPFWFQHAMTFERNIDVVAIPVEGLTDRDSIECVNDRTYPQLLHFAGSDIFVLGHPLPRKDSKYPFIFPVWKRGSIASEIIVPWNMRPAFLIDSRTSKGMSGSPVFARAFGPVAHGDGTMKLDNILDSEFMGVYSGRIYDDENNASIGLVWHRNLIDQILQDPVPGSRGWKSSVTLEVLAPLLGKQLPPFR